MTCNCIHGCKQEAVGPESRPDYIPEMCIGCNLTYLLGGEKCGPPYKEPKWTPVTPNVATRSAVDAAIAQAVEEQIG